MLDKNWYLLGEKNARPRPQNRIFVLLGNSNAHPRVFYMGVPQDIFLLIFHDLIDDNCQY